MEKKPLLNKAAQHVENLFENKTHSSLKYHNFKHTLNVVKHAEILATEENLNTDETEILLLAAWFHDTGYLTQKEDHEKISCEEAKIFLDKQHYSSEKINEVCQTIMATRYPQKPESHLQKILCDADLSNVGSKNYFKRSKRLRKELELLDSKFYEECDWLKFEMNFLTQHQFHTNAALKLYNQTKAENLAMIEQKSDKIQISLNQQSDKDTIEKDFAEENINLHIVTDKKDSLISKNQEENINSENSSTVKKKKKKNQDTGRGVETMFRTASKTHINLSAMADSKANIMLSINALIVSITLSALMPKLDSNPHLIVPTVMLVFTCLLTIVFATLSTKPKISHGKFSMEDIQNKQSNLLFFGNFHNMELSDFKWGIEEMMKDNNFLYASLTQDLYFLGKVLAKKYTYLRICYTIFMYGLILSVIAFGISLSFH